MGPAERELLSSLVPIQLGGGSIFNHVSAMCRSKYYLRVGGGARQGNSIPEAISSGCLYLGSSNQFNNRDTFTPATDVETWQDAYNQIKTLESDPKLYAENLKYQRLVSDYSCFLRPVSEMITRLYKKRGTA
jgi:hypothetical protein